jgi:Ca2+-binding EF-hand superfamily protein
MYDKNGDSKISIDEFGEVIKNLGLNVTETHLSKMMEEIDLDGSGTVDFNEFAIWMSIKMSEDKANDLENTFKIFDENGDHFITAQELKNVMNKLGQTLTDEEINLMISEADADGDKKVNFKGMKFNSKFDLNFKFIFFFFLKLEFVQLMRKLEN